MSRQLRRVPLDFNFPRGKTWPGFLMPEDLSPDQCEHCDGMGYSPFAKLLHERWYGYAPFDPASRGSEPFTPDTPGIRRFAERQCQRTPGYYGSGEEAIRREGQRIANLYNQQWAHHLNQDDVDALVAEGRLMDLTHRWDTDERKWIPTGHHPTAAEVNDWSCTGFGHDSINQWIVLKAECERVGISSRCEHCDGEGSIYRDAAHKDAYDNWKPTDPPEGPGYQMWESVSEGSAISPVFADPQDLANWLATHRDEGTAAQWMKMIMGTGWAPSGIITGDGQSLTGVQFVGRDQ